MKKCLYIFLTASLLSLPMYFVSQAGEGDKASKLLKRAWDEYGYREFETAEDYFEKAKKAAVTKEDICQALTGIAFCYQFGKQINVTVSDFREAISKYKEALKVVGEKSKYTPFLKSMINECNFRIAKLEKDKKLLEETKASWDKFQEENNGSLLAQDALLYRITYQADSLTTKEALERAVILEKYLNPLCKNIDKKLPPDEEKKMLLTAPMANYLGLLYFFQKNYTKSIEWMEKYYRLGPTTRQGRASVLFKMARTSELKLKDNKKAVKYYETFRDEIKNDSRLYFAGEKKKQLQKDK